MKPLPPLEILLDQTEQSPVIAALREHLSAKMEDANDAVTATECAQRDWWAGYKFAFDEIEVELRTGFERRRAEMGRQGDQGKG